MSVPLTKRGEQKFEVLLKAHDLAAYTIKAASSEKVIPKRYRWCSSTKLVDAAVDIDRYLTMANSLNLFDEDSAKQRRSYQDLAYASSESLLSMLDIAYNAFSIDSEKIDTWTGLVVNVQSLIENWIKSDERRRKG